MSIGGIIAASAARKRGGAPVGGSRLHGISNNARARWSGDLLADLSLSSANAITVSAKFEAPAFPDNAVVHGNWINGVNYTSAFIMRYHSRSGGQIESWISSVNSPGAAYLNNSDPFLSGENTWVVQFDNPSGTSSTIWPFVDTHFTDIYSRPAEPFVSLLWIGLGFLQSDRLAPPEFWARDYAVWVNSPLTLQQCQDLASGTVEPLTLSPNYFWPFDGDYTDTLRGITMNSTTDTEFTPIP
jgi:hypothetical protein